jgi:hypothetical protein
MGNRDDDINTSTFYRSTYHTSDVEGRGIGVDLETAAQRGAFCASSGLLATNLPLLPRHLQLRLSP